MKRKRLLWLTVLVYNQVMLLLWASGSTGAEEKGGYGVPYFPLGTSLQRPKDILQGQTWILQHVQRPCLFI